MISAISAVIIAIVLVSGVVAIGVLNTTHTNSLPPFSYSTITYPAQSNSSPQVSVQSTASQSTIIETSQSYSGQNTGSGPSGTLAVLMTDPPTVPEGVTNVFITYSDLGIHVSGDGNNSGWHVLNVGGQIDLMSIINSTETVADANITSGVFNALAFNMTSAIVTFQGQNYTADLVYQNHMLFVPIVGGITISAGQTSAAVIDISPTVLLLGNTTNPTFALLPSATAYTVPASSVSTLHLKVGNTDNIQNAPWWVNIERGSRFEITGVALTPDGLSFNVTNTGNFTVLLRIAAVVSKTSVAGGKVPISNFGQLLMISEVFVLERNSTVVPITAVGNGIVENLVDSAGFVLPVDHTATFTYSGKVVLGGAITSIYPHAPVQQITPGQTYTFALTGNGQLAATYVVAES